MKPLLMFLLCVSISSVNADWQMAADDKLTVENTRKASLGKLPDGLKPVRFDAEHSLDILKETGRGFAPGEPAYGRPAILVNTFESDSDGELLCGAGADYFLAVFCNGRECFENLRYGNAGTPISALDNLFTVPVKKGTNTIALLVRSGSKGWKVAFQPLEDTPENRSRLAGSTGSGTETALNFHPWITDSATGTATIRFVTKCESYAAVDFRKAGASEWTRRYDRIGHYFLRNARHSIRLKGLEADSVYEFRIALFQENKVSNGSLPISLQNETVLPEIYKFRSAPAPEAGFRFCVMTDTHLPAPSRRAMLGLYDKRFDFGKSDFFVHLGDIASSIDNFDDQVLYGFTDHFNRNGMIQPLCVVQGNHEYSGRDCAKWLSAFSTSGTGTCRAFRYGNTFFVVLEYWDSQTAESKEMEEWAVKALHSEESRSATFRVVMNHAPSFLPDSPPTAVAALLERLGKSAKIHLCLSGHSHRYCRTNPEAVSYLARPEFTMTKHIDVPATYVSLTLDGGESPMAVNLTEIKVTGDRMHIRSAKADGTVFDEFIIDRNGNTL